MRTRLIVPKIVAGISDDAIMEQLLFLKGLLA
jgi:hypothetical protein